KLVATSEPKEEGAPIRFAEAVRRTLARELELNPRVLVFGEDVGRKGGVHLVTEGLQKRFGESRVFDTSLSEEGIIGRAVGMAIGSPNPSVFFEHRSLLMTSDGSAKYPGDDYVLPFGKAATLLDGTDLTLVSWGALVHRCREAADKFAGRVELLDLRTISPWD